MKVPEKKHNIESSGLEEPLEFTVSESSFLFDILSTKLYKNPQKALVREFTANSTDANVEGGKGNQPIEVFLPTYSANYFVSKDYGLGISPERIREVFCVLGESTKRNTNKAIGSFGLGKNVFLALADSMTVETIYDSKRYVYVVYKGQNGIPAISSDNYEGEPTDLPSGTKITIPIKKSDVEAVKREGLDLFRFFKVKPICNLTLPTYSPLFETDTYTLDKGENYYTSKCYAVMGSIVYPIEQGTLKLVDGYILYLRFKIGEVNVEASREGLHYDDKTKKALASAFADFTKDIGVKLAEEFKDLKGWELYCKMNEVHKKFNNLIKCEKQIELDSGCGKIYSPGYQFKRVEEYVDYPVTVIPTNTKTFFIRDKEDRFLKPLQEWSSKNNKSTIYLVEDDQVKLDAIKKVTGLEDKDFLRTSMFKALPTKRGSISIRNVTILQYSKFKSGCYRTISTVPTIKYYVIRKGFDISYGGKEHNPSYLIKSLGFYVRNGVGTNYKGQPIYAILQREVKNLPKDALEVVGESLRIMEDDVGKNLENLEIARGTKLNDFNGWDSWDIPILRETYKELSKILTTTSNLYSTKSTLEYLTGKKFEYKKVGKFKHEKILDKCRLLNYVSVPSDKDDKKMVECILCNQLKGLKL